MNIPTFPTDITTEQTEPSVEAQTASTGTPTVQEIVWQNALDRHFARLEGPQTCRLADEADVNNEVPVTPETSTAAKLKQRYLLMLKPDL